MKVAEKIKYLVKWVKTRWMREMIRYSRFGTFVF